MLSGSLFDARENPVRDFTAGHIELGIAARQTIFSGGRNEDSKDPATWLLDKSGTS